MRWSSTVRLMVRQAHHAAHDEACDVGDWGMSKAKALLKVGRAFLLTLSWGCSCSCLYLAAALRLLTSATVRAAREANAASPIHGVRSSSLLKGTYRGAADLPEILQETGRSRALPPLCNEDAEVSRVHPSIAIEIG
jgi:hypothetical protein